MVLELTDLTIVSFLLSCASLYGPGVFPDAIYISNLDEFDARIRPVWRRLAVGCFLFSASMLGVIFIPSTYAMAEQFSNNTNAFGLIDSIVFLGVLITWILSFVFTLFCWFLENVRKQLHERDRLGRFR